MNYLKMCCLAVFAVALAACGGSDAQSPSETSNDAQQAAWLLKSEPADAVSVTTAKASAKEGEKVVVRARIGGRKEPITEHSAAFTVMDLKVPHCGQNPGDNCPTPWDYCCETPKTIAANAATVKLVDDKGNMLEVNPVKQGLKPLDEVIIVGTVAPQSTDDVLMVNATGVHRVAQ